MKDLKTLIETHWAVLTPNQQRVGDYALSNPFLVATMGIEDLAKAAAVSAPTITRFVRQLGLKSYADFRAIAIRRYQDLLRPIENVSRAQGSSADDVVAASVRAARENLDGFAADLVADHCAALVDRMAAAERVAMLGFGSSALCMTYLHGLTEPFLRNAMLLTGTGGHERMARLIGGLGPRDLLIAMSLPRYSYATIEFVRLARTTGVPCIGLSDSDHSPLGALCEQTIRLPAAHPVLNSSAAAAFILVETIAALLTARHQSTSQATATTRLIFPYLYTDGAPALATAKDAT